MGSPGNAQAQNESRNRRLGSWKEIAAYLNKGERTVRRWEQFERLPIYRHVHEKAASVYAYSNELDAWFQSRGAKPQALALKAFPTPSRLLVRAKIAAITFGALVTGGVITALLLPLRFADEQLLGMPLTTYPGDEVDPSFSPNGSQVAFSWNGPSQDNFDIYVKTIGQENYLRITRDPEEDFDPVWSPDGRFIAFLRKIGERQAAVMLVSPLGGTEIMLAKFPYSRIPGLRTSFSTRYLSWHPSSKYLVAAVPGPGPSVLHALWLSGEVRKLTTPEIAGSLGDLNPSFAPNGKTLAFTRYSHSAFGGQIYTLALSRDGKAAAQPQPVWWSGRNTVSAIWAHDGRQLVYQRYGHHTLWRTMAFENRTPSRLTVDSAEIQGPAISRDSNSLVFSSGRTDLDIARSDISGVADQPQIQRVSSSTQPDTEARLSPDERRIVFASERSGRRAIWISGVEDSPARKLTNPSEGIHEHPSWSPDGKRIAFGARLSGGNGRIYIAPADQPNVESVTNGSADDSTPRWSRDGRWLYFSSNRTGRREVWKASTFNFGDQHQVTFNGGDGAIESPNGAYLYYVHRSALSGPQHLRRIKTSTGEEDNLLESREISWWDFVPGKDGLYFVDVDSGESKPGRVLFFYEIGTGQIRRVASLPKSYYCCPEVSKDGRQVYYSVQNNLGHDLMMVQRFQ